MNNLAIFFLYAVFACSLASEEAASKRSGKRAIGLDYGLPLGYSYGHESVQQRIVPVPEPVAVPVLRPVPVPVPVRPYPSERQYPTSISKQVIIPYPQQVPVPIPVRVVKAVPYPVPVPVMVAHPFVFAPHPLALSLAAHPHSKVGLTSQNVPSGPVTLTYGVVPVTQSVSPQQYTLSLHSYQPPHTTQGSEQASEKQESSEHESAEDAESATANPNNEESFSSYPFGYKINPTYRDSTGSSGRSGELTDSSSYNFGRYFTSSSSNQLKKRAPTAKVY